MLGRHLIALHGVWHNVQQFVPTFDKLTSNEWNCHCHNLSIKKLKQDFIDIVCYWCYLTDFGSFYNNMPIIKKVLRHFFIRKICFDVLIFLNTILLFQTTGLVGLAVAANAHHTLNALYGKILRTLQKMPDCPYKKYTEQIVRDRTCVVQSVRIYYVLQWNFISKSIHNKET